MPYITYVNFMTLADRIQHKYRYREKQKHKKLIVYIWKLEGNNKNTKNKCCASFVLLRLNYSRKNDVRFYVGLMFQW